VAPCRGESFLCGREEKVEKSEKEGERKTLKWGKERMEKKNALFSCVKKKSRTTGNGRKRSRLPYSSKPPF
jgi:hypothetical protein